MASSSTTPAAAGASNAVPAVKNKSTPASNPLATKLAKNKRLPATMINSSSGSVDASKKKKKSASRKQNKRLEEGKEKALERSSKLEERVREREERKVGLRSQGHRVISYAELMGVLDKAEQGEESLGVEIGKD